MRTVSRFALARALPVLPEGPPSLVTQSPPPLSRVYPAPEAAQATAQQEEVLARAPCGEG